jgi:hypothetical protein
MSITTVDLDDTIALWRLKTNEISDKVGDLDSLGTAAGANLVAAINEHDAEIGDIPSLTTSNKTNLVSSINELDDEIGPISSLTTSDKTDLVSSINELDIDIGNRTSLTTSDKTNLVSAINEHDAEIGNVLSLTTTNKTNLVSAINEHESDIGNKTSLTTSNKTNLVSAINEHESDIIGLNSFTAGLDSDIGTRTSLTTSDKTNLVAAINEHDAEIGSIQALNTIDKTNLVSAINEHDADIGLISALTTSNKTNLVSAINEHDAEIGSIQALNTIDKTNLVSAINEHDAEIGLISALTTTNKSSLVAAINEHDTDIGDKASLTTGTKTNLVSAINEHESDIIGLNSFTAGLDSDIGTRTSLTTSDKTNLVSAINEVRLNVGLLTDLGTANRSSTVAAINELVLQVSSLDSNGVALTTIIGDLDSDTNARIDADSDRLTSINSTLISSINTKLNSSSYTASDVLTKIKTVDGVGSGLDADTLDGKHFTQVKSDIIDTITNGAGAAYDTLVELQSAIQSNDGDISSILTTLNNKVSTTSPQALRSTDALTVSNDTITIHKGDGTTESVTISDANTWRPVVNNLTSTNAAASLSANQGRVLKGLVDTVSAKDPTLTLIGDVTGIATFTNLGNASLTTTVANDSHTHDGRYYTESELSAVGTSRTTSGAYKIGVFDELSQTNATNVQDVLDDLDQQITKLSAVGTSRTTSGAYKIVVFDELSQTNATNVQDVLDDLDQQIANLEAKDITLTLAGDLSGSVTFTNLGSGTLTATVADDSHNHIIANVDGLQTALDSKLNSTSYTATDVLTKIKTVDGSGSGLDADLLDGQQGSYYYPASNPNGYTTYTANQALNTTSNPTFNDVYVSDQIIHKGDTDTYMQFHAADQWRVVTGGSERLEVNNTNVTISNTLVESSDARLKENVETLENSLDKVRALRGVSYNKIESPEYKEIGFIAQEVEEVVPELVTTDETEDAMKAVSYGRTVALLVEAVKELKAEVEELKAYK